MRNALSSCVSSLRSILRPAVIALGARLTLLMFLAAISFIPAAAQPPVETVCQAGKNCDTSEQSVTATKPEKGLDTRTKKTAKSWITIDEPANIALLFMGLVGLFFGRWAAKHRASEPDED